MATGNSLKTTYKWYFTLARVFLFSLCCIIILIFTSGFSKNIAFRFAEHSSILSATMLTLLLIFFFLKWEKLQFKNVGITPGKHSIPRFLSGYIIGFSMAALQALIVLAYGHFQLSIVPGISVTNILSPFLLYFLIACREELAFRSYSLRSLNIVLGPVWALVIVAIIFIMEHVAGGMTWEMAVLGSGTGAILFGVSALKTKGLALSLGLHSAWNFGQWTFGFKKEPGIWQAVVEKGYESEIENVGLTAFLFIMGITMAGIFFYYRSKKLSE